MLRLPPRVQRTATLVPFKPRFRAPLAIAQLTQGGAISRQAITKHLHVLEQGGLLRSERLGRERRWQLEAQRLADVRICLDRISDQWDAAINRLRAFVEADRKSTRLNSSH